MTKVIFDDFNVMYLFSKPLVMGVIFLLLGISLVVALGFFVAFLFSVKNGQFDDSHTPAIRILFDDEKHPND